MENSVSINTKNAHTISNKTFIADLEPVQCIKYDEDSNYLAAGCNNGKIVILTSARMYNLNCPDSITSLSWKPKSLGSKTKNVLICGESEGGICQWHVTSRKMLHRLEYPCDVFSIDYHKSFPLFVAAGKDGIVRVYDDVTKTMATEFDKKHTSRVFCTKFHPEDNNIIVSGGWDSTVQFWDIRSRESVRSILGPNVCGEAIDFKGDMVLAGSWRDKNSLQIFSYGNGQLIRDIENEHATWVYCTRFSADGNWCVASGSNPNSVVFFENFQHFASISGFSQPVFSFDITAAKRVIATGCGNGTISLYNLS